ncbi:MULTISPECIES: ABC transporter ATP-binding protein [Halolamina]|uniref:Nickel import system ATP-binding protein NikD n=1 Tax=Halolamina pelagica TaxID=699431 RepID=A0A1I5VWR3_9EURY|nr:MULTISPECIES: ABC transporter ATP-binding protein [Halolamina]NHX37528.1 ABC transporter ATP-binding protein [Halolamina sp. R1-12]SFQ11880.1 peptide/nickel transport system ATP-binding protein [Halolamina pelagica]
MSAEAPLLAVENLRTEFYTDKETVRAVDDVNFRIERGETLGIVGESGSGKSVTARSIMGLVESPGNVLPESSIRLDGEELTEKSESEYRGIRGSEVTMVFQDPLTSLNPVYTVGNQLKETLRLHRDLDGQTLTDTAIGLLEDVGIPDAARRISEYPHEFSGGMQQRAVIALALACDPELLICDEPTTALDVTIQAQILELLAEIQVERDIGIMFITHDMGVIAEVADRVAVMYAGEIVESAPVRSLYSDPAHPYTNGLLDSIPGNQPGGRELTTIEGEVPIPNGAATHCRFAPRCPKAFEECYELAPEPLPTTAGKDDHTAACLLFPEDMKREDAVDEHRAANTEGTDE